MKKIITLFIIILISSCTLIDKTTKDDKLVIENNNKDEKKVQNEKKEEKLDINVDAQALEDKIKKSQEEEKKERTWTVDIKTEISTENYEEFIDFLKERDISKEENNKKLNELVIFLNSNNKFDKIEELLNNFENKSYFLEESKKIYEKILELKIFNNNRIGIIIPKNSKYKNLSIDLENGFNLAKKELGSSIEIIIKESDSSKEDTMRAYNELIFQDKVLLVLGTIRTDNSLEIAKLSNAFKVPFISVAKSYKIALTGEYIFNYFSGIDDITETIAKYSIEKLKLKNFAILYPDSSYGKRNMVKFWNFAEKYSGKITGVQSYSSDPENTSYIPPSQKLVGKHYLQYRKDYMEKRRQIIKRTRGYVRKKELEKLEKELLPIIDFDAVFIPDSSSVTTLLLPYLALYDINFNTGDRWQEELAAMKAKDKKYDLKFVQLLGTPTWASTSILDGAAKYAKGGIFPVIYDERVKDEKIVNFTKKYKETYSKKPSFYSLLSYELIEILSKTLTNQENINNLRDKVKDTLLITNFDVLSGKATFNKDGNAKRNLFLMKFSSRDYYQIDK